MCAHYRILLHLTFINLSPNHVAYQYKYWCSRFSPQIGFIHTARWTTAPFSSTLGSEDHGLATWDTTFHRSKHCNLRYEWEGTLWAAQLSPIHRLYQSSHLSLHLFLRPQHIRNKSGDSFRWKTCKIFINHLDLNNQLPFDRNSPRHILLPMIGCRR